MKLMLCNVCGASFERAQKVPQHEVEGPTEALIRCKGSDVKSDRYYEDEAHNWARINRVKKM